MGYADNFGYALKIFLKFCTVKGVKRYMEIILTVFLKKNLIWGKLAILGLKMAHPHNSGSTLRIFLKFCTMKGAKRHMKSSPLVFPKNMSFWANGTFFHNSDPFKEFFYNIAGPKMLCSQTSGSTLKDLFIILHNERGEEARES